MIDKQVIIDGVDVSGCSWCVYAPDEDAYCLINDGEDLSCEDNPNCYYKQLKRKEQECERLKKELHKNFEEKDTLHLIIDRLLEASGYDTNTASAEDFEDVYECMRYEQQQLNQLRKENEELKKQLTILDDEDVVVEITAKQFEEHKKLKAELHRANCQIADDEILQCDMRETIEELKAKNEILKQTLTEIKEVLQFYNNSKIGIDKGNGIFEFEVSNVLDGKLICCYDSNPAKQALQKISECEAGDEK